MRVEFDVFGEKQVARELMRVGSRAFDLRPPFMVMRRYFYAMERQQFATEGGFASGGWDPLNADYLRRKIAAGKDPHILRADDVLMKSLTSASARYSVSRIRKDSMDLGTSAPHAEFHQSKRPRSKMPMRRFIEFRERDRVVWVKILQQHILTGEVPGVPGL